MSYLEVILSVIPIAGFLVTLIVNVFSKREYDEKAYREVYYKLNRLFRELPTKKLEDFKPKINEFEKLITNENRIYADNTLEDIFKKFTKKSGLCQKIMYRKLRTYVERRYDLLCAKLGVPSKARYLDYILEFILVSLLAFLVLFCCILALQALLIKITFLFA
jgi:hypothetical protein